VSSHSAFLCVPWRLRPPINRLDGQPPFLWQRLVALKPWIHSLPLDGGGFGWGAAPHDGPFNPVKMPAMPADSGMNWTAVKPCEAIRSQKSCGAGNSMIESLRY
jgi:hypothetical protein